jgi:putative acetyltransferase
MTLLIRSEDADEITTIHRIHTTAFPTDAEARLVDRLRANGKAIISLVAEENSQIVGHLLFSPVTLEPPAATGRGLGLAPVAVLPGWQRRGIGTQLIEAGLVVARQAGYGFVVVLGEPVFYERFGFQPASRRLLDNEYGAGDAFMLLEWGVSTLPASGGLVKYVAEFAELAG